MGDSRGGGNWSMRGGRRLWEVVRGVERYGEM